MSLGVLEPDPHKSRGGHMKALRNGTSLDSYNHIPIAITQSEGPDRSHACDSLTTNDVGLSRESIHVPSPQLL